MVWISLRALLLAVIGGTCLLLLVPASASDEEDESKQVTILPQGSTRVTDLLCRIGKLTPRALVWDEADPAIEGRRLMSSRLLRAPSGTAQEMLGHLLRLHGLTLQPAAKDRAAPAFVRSVASQSARVHRTICLEHSCAEDLAGTLHLHLGAGTRASAPLQISADLRTNNLFLSGAEDDVATAESLISALDVPVYVSQSCVHIVRLKHRDCEAMASLLSRLVNSSSVFGRPRTMRRPAPPRRRYYYAAWEQEEVPAIVADPGSRSLIIAGTRWQFAHLLQVIEALDLDPLWVRVGDPAEDG